MGPEVMAPVFSLLLLRKLHNPMRSISLFLLLFCSLYLAAQTKPAADLIIGNANIWTVDPSLPKAQAVAILGHRIVAVGSNADVDVWRGAQTRVLDAQGKLLLPGFNDAHTHFASGGFQLEGVQLTDATSPQEFVRRIAAQARKLPKGEWMQGGDWDETKWNPAKLPTKEMIDAVTPD